MSYASSTFLCFRINERLKITGLCKVWRSLFPLFALARRLSRLMLFSFTQSDSRSSNFRLSEAPCDALCLLYFRWATKDNTSWKDKPVTFRSQMAYLALAAADSLFACWNTFTSAVSKNVTLRHSADRKDVLRRTLISWFRLLVRWLIYRLEYLRFYHFVLYIHRAFLRERGFKKIRLFFVRPR